MALPQQVEQGPYPASEETKEVNGEIDTDCFICIDVECAAIGHGHFDKMPCRIAMVSYSGRTLFDEIVKVPNLKDSLHEFTGLTAQEVEDGICLTDALRTLHTLLIEMQSKHKNGVTIVGQAPQNDCIWIKLVRGTHYNHMIDLAQIFRNGQYYYSLRKTAYCLLNQEMNKKYHDPTEDARISMQLYREYARNVHKLQAAKEKLMRMGKARLFPDFTVRTKFAMCSGMSNPRYCWCKQQTARGVNEVLALSEIVSKTEPIVEMTADMTLRRTFMQLRF